MDPTMISVFAVGATLAALILTGQRSLRTEIGAVETRLGKRIDDTKTELRSEIAAVQGEVKEVETRLGRRIDRLEERVTGLDSRLSHLEGVLSAVLGPFRRAPLPEPTPDESPA